MFKQILHVLGSSTARDGEGEGASPAHSQPQRPRCCLCCVPALPAERCSALPAGGHGKVRSLQRPLVEQQFEISTCVLKKGEQRSTLGEQRCVPCKLPAPLFAERLLTDSKVCRRHLTAEQRGDGSSLWAARALLFTKVSAPRRLPSGTDLPETRLWRRKERCLRAGAVQLLNLCDTPAHTEPSARGQLLLPQSRPPSSPFSGFFPIQTTHE